MSKTKVCDRDRYIFGSIGFIQFIYLEIWVKEGPAISTSPETAKMLVEQCLSAIQKRDINKYKNCFEESVDFSTLNPGELGRFIDTNLSIENILLEDENQQIIQVEIKIEGKWVSYESDNFITINRSVRAIQNRDSLELYNDPNVKLPYNVWRIRQEDIGKLPFDFSSSKSDIKILSSPTPNDP